MRQVTVGYQDGCLAPFFVTQYSIKKAIECGMDTVWVPDHLMGFAPKWMWEPDVCSAASVIHSGDALFDPVAVLSYAAAAFPDLRLGTSVTDPIRRHPVSLAQSFVTLDHLSGGRAVLGIGNGLVENTEPYGFPSNRRVARLEEALSILAMLFESEGRPVDFDGEFYRLDGAVFDLPMFEDRPPPIFVGAHAPRMLGLTGRFGSGWLPGQRVDAATYAQRLDVIRTAANDAGREFSDFTATQTLLLILGEDRDALIEQALASPYVAYNALGLPGRAWRALGEGHPLGDAFEGNLELVPSLTTPEHVAAAQDALSPEMLDMQYYFGSAREIADELAPLVEVGCSHVILANMGGNFTGRGMRDFETMAELTTILRSMNAAQL